VAAVILHHPDSQLQAQINEMKDKVEQLLLWAPPQRSESHLSRWS
jgi:hypothetical protein